MVSFGRVDFLSPIVSNTVSMCTKKVCGLALAILEWLVLGSSRVWDMTKGQVVADKYG